MLSNTHEKTENFLQNFVKSLEISDTAQQKAEERYVSIGGWLGREGSLLAQFKPELYSQGSIRLGTTIRPLNENEEYDLDAVCLLNSLGVNSATQKQIKELVGHELKLYVKANNFQNPLDEGRRCWTLQYSDKAQFHMDILPSLPDEEGLRKRLIEESRMAFDAISKLHTATAIAITDNMSIEYGIISSNWNKSNPKGYHEWFKDRCKIIQFSNESRLFKASDANIEEIPDHTMRLPLQKAIMILKRHRDIMFKDDGEHKPISIIITTLAAKAYKGTSGLKDTLDTLVYEMINHITCNTNGYCVVLNPVNPNENYADKWADNPVKRDNFIKWLNQLKADYTYLISNQYGDNKFLLENKFGKKAIQSTYRDSFGMIEQLKIKAKELLALPHIQKPQWTFNPQNEVKIVCQKSRNGMLHQELKSGEAIGRGWNLRFEAKIHDVASSRKFYWQVANSGEEAESAKCLRGGFYDGEVSRGGKVREESTSYIGSHFVRCYIVQHNQCIAVSEPFIIEII